MTKQLYKINELVELLGVTSRTIRYYDQFGLLKHVKRSKGGMRLFDDEDIEIIKKIRRMQKEEFLPLDVIKEKLFGKKEDYQINDRIVLTDSTVTLSEEIKKKLNIEVISLKIKTEDHIYLENELNIQSFLEKTKNLSIPLITIPPTEEEFIDKYLELAKKGYKEIYSIHLTSTASNTYLNAFQAAHKVADRVTVYPIDSKTGGPGLRAFVFDIAQALINNQSKEEIDLLIAKNLPLIKVFFMSNTIKHLFTNFNFNILNQTQKSMMQKMFAFKPVMEVKDGTGEFEIVSWCKEKNEALKIILDILDKEIAERIGYARKIYIDYNYMYGEALELINQIKNRYPNAEIAMQEGSPVLSTYLGPQTIAISIN
ncbi:MAG: DegV family protein [Candidatus Margulisiibacteriota bacterium]|jgi:DegV family protein with EDD domain